MTAPSRATLAGQVYLDLRRKACQDRRPVDELIQLCHSVHEVARHRRLELRPLAEVLPGYGDIGQQRWTAWRAKQQLGDRLPEQFHDVVTSVVDFADPAITGTAAGHSWDPAAGAWF